MLRLLRREELAACRIWVTACVSTRACTGLVAPLAHDSVWNDKTALCQMRGTSTSYLASLHLQTFFGSVCLTLKREAASDFKAVSGVVSLSSCNSACQCQEDSQLANELKRSEARQEQSLVLNKGCPSTKICPLTPALQLEMAAS